jgi:hypothetical protein
MFQNKKLINTFKKICSKKLNKDNLGFFGRTEEKPGEVR